MKKTIIITTTKDIHVCDFCGEELPEDGFTRIDDKEYHNWCYRDLPQEVGEAKCQSKGT